MASSDPNDDDPIIASYPVFLKPTLPAHQKLLLLQYIYRDHPKERIRPTEVRIKPKTGMVELDLPLDTGAGYDKGKGMGWGAALASSTKAKAGGSHGLAGGFGIGGTQTRGGRSGKATAGDDDDASDLTWNQAVREGKILKHLTIGGMCRGPEDETNYMIGVFQGDNLHLTPVTSLVHLRPQLHHLDAATELDRQKQHNAAGGGGGGGGGGAGGGNTSTTTNPPSGKEGGGGGGSGGTARAIHMTIKSAGADGDDVVTETMADRVRAVQMEAWQRMEYRDEDRDEAWAAYGEHLFLHPPSAAQTAAVGKGKGREQGRGGDGDELEGEGEGGGGGGGGPGASDLMHRVPSLNTDWDGDDLLWAYSGMERPGDVKVDDADDEAADTAGSRGGEREVAAPAATADESSKRGRSGRPRGSAAVRGGRGGRGRGGASSRGGAAAMDLD